MVGVDPRYLYVDAHPHVDAPRLPLMTRTPLQGSISGRGPIFHVRGGRLRHGYLDASHYGLGRRHRGGLIPLPPAYTDLCREATFPSALSGVAVDEPAVCLVCGQVLRSGQKDTRRLGPTSAVAPTDIGECSLHARSCNAGVGVFFLVTKVQVLLVRGRMSAVHPSVYVYVYVDVDVNGEVPEVPEVHGLLRPMYYLSAKRRGMRGWKSCT